MTPSLKALAGAVAAASLLMGTPLQASTASELNLPEDRIQRSLACIGTLWSSIDAAEAGIQMGYDRQDMEDTAGAWAVWVSKMTGLTTDQVYALDEVGKYRDAFMANDPKARAQLGFCMTERPG